MQKFSTPAAFGTPFKWVMGAYRNCFVTALAAFESFQPIIIELENASNFRIIGIISNPFHRCIPGTTKINKK
jgi:hypothetical protein